MQGNGKGEVWFESDPRGLRGFGARANWILLRGTWPYAPADSRLRFFEEVKLETELVTHLDTSAPEAKRPEISPFLIFLIWSVFSQGTKR